MKPKEKAKELMCKMYGCEESIDLDFIYTINPEGYLLAKDNALIAIDEILDVLDAQCWGLDMDKAFEKQAFWQEVKQEIEKL